MTKLRPTQAGFVGVHARLDGLKAQQGLREDLFGGIAAQDLVDVADLNLAGGRGLGSAAVLDVAAQRFGGAHILAVNEDLIAQADGEQRIAVAGKVGNQRDSGAAR